MHHFEDAFNILFDIPEPAAEDYCLVSPNCEITLPDGEKFCGTYFKSSDRALTLQEIKPHLEKTDIDAG